jgi:hypothetical protein
MTPQQLTELERRYQQLKYQDYLQVIHDYVNRDDKAA